MPTRSFYIKESELDDYQIRIIKKKTDNSFIVKGCAGSGKSILALWKAKQIQDEKKGTFLFIVFTKTLKKYMLDGLKQIGISSENVETYGKCFYWSKQDGDWVQGEWKRGSVDYILVDEAQDFTEDQIMLLKSKASKALLLYGDSAQQLYASLHGKKTMSMKQISEITNFLEEQLVFNHRLPTKIARLAQRILSGEDKDDLEGRCRNEGFEKPKVLRHVSLFKQLDAIKEVIINRKFEDVGILFKKNEDVEAARDYLIKIGLNVEAKFGQNHMDLNFDSDNPKLMTYHSSKGLQFEAVFLPDCSCSRNDDRNPLYVALTRTYQSLYIMHSGNLSSFFDDIPTDLYETEMSTAITELL